MKLKLGGKGWLTRDSALTSRANRGETWTMRQSAVRSGQVKSSQVSGSIIDIDVDDRKDRQTDATVQLVRYNAVDEHDVAFG